MSGRPDLADRLAFAIVAHGPRAGSRLARDVVARKDDVLRELRVNARFEQVGRGRATTWRLAWEPHRAAWEPQTADDGRHLGKVSTLAPRDLVALRQTSDAALGGIT